MTKIVLGAVLIIMSAACTEEHCRAGSTRCRGETVEVCDANGTWADVADCLNVTGSEVPSWRCCAIDELADAGALHACLPQTECAEVSE